MKSVKASEMRKVNGGKTYTAVETCPICGYRAVSKISYWVDFMNFYKNTAKANARKKLLEHKCCW